MNLLLEIINNMIARKNIAMYVQISQNASMLSQQGSLNTQPHKKCFESCSRRRYNFYSDSKAGDEFA